MHVFVSRLGPDTGPLKTLDLPQLHDNLTHSYLQTFCDIIQWYNCLVEGGGASGEYQGWGGGGGVRGQRPHLAPSWRFTGESADHIKYELIKDN